MTGDWKTLLPLLVHIQANLEGDLSLAALSRKSGLSPFHLQRRFKAVEIYHTTRVNVRYRLNHTDLCLPVVAGPALG